VVPCSMTEIESSKEGKKKEETTAEAEILLQGS
jgi:hypothetical protein